MLTRRGVAHQYGAGGYAPEPFHVAMPAGAIPPGDRPVVSRYYQPPLNAAVTAAGTAVLRPYVGMDPSDPGTWSRPYNPQQGGLFMRLHQDQAKARGQEPQRRRRGRRGSRG